MSFHPFHMVEQSPWPILSSFNCLMLMTGVVLFSHKKEFFLLFFSFFIILLNMFQWWRDVTREGTYQGSHTLTVKKGLKMGMILFIVSEIFFFISFFWAFFHMSLSPDIEIGFCWPPIGIQAFNPFSIPLLNTIILLSSGFTVTWAHHAILNSNKNSALFSLSLTVFLGVYFSFLQMMEYNEAPFSIADSVFGTTFFLTTGFHGLHVLIGTTFLFINLIRLNLFHFNNNHHLGFEAAAWYWHFVDVVWIFLYIFMYWWVF